MKTANNELWKLNEKDPYYRHLWKLVKPIDRPRLPLIKDVFIALALGAICALSIYFLSVPANAYDLDPTLSLSFSGHTIRVKFFQIEPRDQMDYEDKFIFLHQELSEAQARDDHDYACDIERQLDILKINFAEEINLYTGDANAQSAKDILFDGQSKWISAQTLIFVEDNAIMNYHLDDPLEIILLAEIITQQIENALNYEPDALTFILFDSSLAIVYNQRLWTSGNYFEEAAEAIDRQEVIRQEERTNENMYPDREEEPHAY